MSDPAGAAAKRQQSPTQLHSGDVLGDRFIIVQFLARGGMGEVYEAADRHLQDKHCALKTLRSEIADDPAVRSRFEREVLLAREVTHPNVCTTFDLFRAEGPHGPVLFLTMKLVRGESLSARLSRSGRMDPESGMQIIRQMANALDAAHRAGVIHRDFKPGNVMLEGTGPDTRVSVTDFGLSRAYAADNTLAESGYISGTLGYIAPEILQGHTATPASDIYAFGVVLHEILTGQKPVQSPGKTSFVRPSRAAPDLPRAWDRVILGCLELDPARRFQSAGEALSALDVRSPSTRSTIGRPALSRRRLLALAALVAVILVGVAWMGRSVIYRLLHPLPQKRFVALMVWPAESNSENKALLNSILDTVRGRLVRAESTVRDLLVISASDVSGQSAPKTPVDAASALGANLVLAAAVRPSASGTTLDLTVLDSATGKKLRQDQVSVGKPELNRLPEKGAISAAQLLDVPSGVRLRDQDELANVTTAVFQLYNSAEELMSRPNYSGLDQAIAKYQQALDADPHFALGYARLAMAYTRKFNRTQDRAALNMAARNADLAMRYNPESPQAVLSQAQVDLNSGDAPKAIEQLGQALKLDPGNPQILLHKAYALRSLGRRDEEENVYRDILKERPNYWPAFNELGWILYRRGNYEKAAEAFADANAVAPQVALVLANLGAMYLLLDRKQQAEEAFRKSLDRAPSEVAYINLGNIAFSGGDYRKSLEYYLKARDLIPTNHRTWRNIGDCYAILGDQTRMMESYAKASGLITEALHVNPRRGIDWMDLAFYQAKLGHRSEAEQDLANAESRGATDLYSSFKKAQILALLGRNEEALHLVLECLDKGLSKMDVELALDLKGIRADPRYVGRIARN